MEEGCIKKQKLDLDLFEPCERGDVAQVREQLEAGADPNMKDSGGNTALHYASYHSHVKCAKLLLKYKASIDLQNKYGNTALVWASRDARVECTELLLKHKADPNIQNVVGRTALHEASRYGHVECVKLLLKYGADLNIHDIYGNIALHFAIGECIGVLINWKTYLPPWNRYTTAARYPDEFNKIAFAWLSSSKLPKDLRYLVIPVLAEKWKLI